MASFPTTIYYIRPDDTREEIIREVVTADETRVLLVFPARLKLRLSVLDLVLIRREADRCSRQAACATRNPAIRTHAEQARLPVFATVSRARRQAWERLDGISRQNENPRNPKTVWLFPAEREWKRFPDLQHRRWWEWFLFVFTIFSLFILVVFLFSRAKVTIHPQVKTQSIALTFTGSPKVASADLAGNLPVHELNMIFDAEGSGFSTGNMDFPETYARGEVLLVNLGDEMIDVPQDVIFRTLSTPPVQFQILEAVSLEPGEENAKMAAIQAVLPGENGNVAAETILAVTGILGANLSVSNPEPTSGGVTRQVKTPTENDVEELRKSLLESITTRAEEAFGSTLDAEHTHLIPSTITMDEIISDEVTPTPGETADRFYLAIRVRYTAWMVSTVDLESAAQQLLNASLGTDEQAVEGTLKILPASEPVLQGGEVLWDLLFQQDTHVLIDTAFLQDFSAKRGERLAQWLDNNLDLEGRVEIEHFPGWWRWLPPIPSRIQLEVQ